MLHLKVMVNFKLKSQFKPTGDQPQAINKLVKGLKNSKPHQTLLGVTGSGKTFTMANVIAKTQLPTLVISHNKTLAAQLYQEFRDFFPNNAVSYFVSYYDYYQPEAYIPSSDTYIEKETNVNDEIDRLRLSATTHLLTRPDVIVIASVSCIYNLGSPIEYGQYILELIEGQLIDKHDILARLTDMQYQRNDYQLTRGTFQLKGDLILVWPAYQDFALKIELLDNQIENLKRVNPVSLNTIKDDRPTKIPREVIYPAKHYLTNPLTQPGAVKAIKSDLAKRIKAYKNKGRMVEAFRIEQKVNHDLEMIQNLGYVNGIENYSRYFDGRQPGQAPYTLLDYFKHNCKLFNQKNYLTIVDESHITIPQIGGMYRGDQSRKKTLIDFGFRLPSAIDNRPLKFEEFSRRSKLNIYTSATPNQYEVSRSNGVVEQLVRPTGLVDPLITIKKTANQIQDLKKEAIKRKVLKQRTLVTTLTKKMAEALTDYLNKDADKTKLKVQYLHSDIDTLDRLDILQDLRTGKYDVLVGINLLREGLDLPEVSLVAILDADKQGFLRSTTSLIQTMGRASRHLNGQVIMYADKITDSMKSAMSEVDRRRIIQTKYNRAHGITPKSIVKSIKKNLIKRLPKKTITSSIVQISKDEAVDLNNIKPSSLTPLDKQKIIKGLNREMKQASKSMNFELAIIIRDTIEKLS
jgi:excinuclease ABC subunit B